MGTKINTVETADPVTPPISSKANKMMVMMARAGANKKKGKKNGSK